MHAGEVLASKSRPALPNPLSAILEGSDGRPETPAAGAIQKRTRNEIQPLAKAASGIAFWAKRRADRWRAGTSTGQARRKGHVDRKDFLWTLKRRLLPVPRSIQI